MMKPIVRHAGLTGLFFLLLCCLPARAGAVGSSNNNSDSNDVASSPADDITSLPVVAADDSGITFVGTGTDLRALGLVFEGDGRLDVVTLPRGGYALTFVGDFRIDVDRAALARGRVGVLFRSGHHYIDGRARLELGDSSTAFLATRRTPLPLGRLAQAPSVQGHFLTLDLLGPNADRARVAGYFDTDRVTLLQRIQ